jgi:aspartate/methionine/tyrosine aminotransferase
MSDILLAKPILPSDWFDVSVGEPHIVRDILLSIFDLSIYELPKVKHMYEYPAPIGYKPLVEALEAKYKAPVIITNGAKQALGACFYALKKMGKATVGMKSPYWALIPPLVEMHGLNWNVTTFGDKSEADSYLLLAPNNPDGSMPDPLHLTATAEALKELAIPFIHDAAYYTHTYLPDNVQLGQYGDVQIYSISKMWGLSGLRVGYVVCPNTEFYKLIQQYMEAMTVGVSIVSQMFTYDLLNRMNGYPSLTEKFDGMSYAALTESKKIIKTVSPEILEVPSNMEEVPGMFGFFKVGPKADFEKAKINFIDGKLFGMPGFVRMNLGFNAKTMQEIVDKLNATLT